ncbi:protein TIC 20-IV, chloroplastic isoform X1 [Ziziphus jujuba]|uniref:Protein TIC 20 n=1 Tax=Ziziphus jujuba TaxID=326968 RepID=A0ABM3IGR5_ZIZJJ|nr:protein TIC 20-IV, chloroplastic isoform X1 [Ziziphus jujuba]
MPAHGCSLGVKPPARLIPPPSIFASGATLRRYKDVILERHKKTSRVACKYNLHVMPIRSSSKSSPRTHLEQHSLLPRGMSFGIPHSMFGSQSSSFLSGNEDVLKDIMTILPRRPRFATRAQANNGMSFGLSFPPMKKKPEWWLRTLACIPYLLALQMSDTGFYLQPLLEHYEHFEDVIYYIPGAVNRLPTWFPMLYCYFAYIGVVKNKNLPHFIRYHIMMAMLMEIALQIVWYSSNFFPLIHFKGTFAMQYWAAVAVAYILTLLECIRCALGGKYVNFPFFRESALIQTLYHVTGFYKPF